MNVQPVEEFIHYQVARFSVAEMQGKIAEIDAGIPTDDERDRRFRQLERTQLQHVISRFEQRMAEYEVAHPDELAKLAAQPFAEVAYALLAARLRLKVDREELAARLGVTAQQLDEWERTNYAGATLQQVGGVISALGLTLTLRADALVAVGATAAPQPVAVG